MLTLLRKSQESAPIELVIAVIIMVMSLTLAFSVWNGIQTSQCLNQIQSQMLTIENAVVDVSLGSPPTQRMLYINFPICGNYNIQSIRFAYYGTPSFCGNCPGSSSGCWKIEPLTFNSKSSMPFTTVTQASVCVNVPASIEFVKDSSSDCNNNNNIDNNSNGCPPISTLPSTFSSQSPLGCEEPTGSNFYYATIGKGSQNQYKLTLSKGYATASGTVEISMCLQGK